MYPVILVSIKLINQKIKNGDNYTHLHAHTRQFIDICILAPLREPCKLRVSVCKCVTLFINIFFSFYKNYPVILVSIKLINQNI